METVRCDWCGSDDAQTLYSREEWKQAVPEGLALVRCRRCHLMYLSPRPDHEEIVAFYPSDYPPYRPAVEDERFIPMRWMRRRKLARRRGVVEQYSAKQKGQVLDVGCATGLFLHEMARAGWSAVGIEPMHEAANYARARFGIEVVGGTLADANFASKSFDAITFWDVLEHTFSPRMDLARAARLLKPGGIVAINVPNWHSIDRVIFGPHWIGLDPPRHLYVFTRNSLSSMLRGAGLQIVDWLCIMPSYFAFAISLERWLRHSHPRVAPLAEHLLNFPGMRFLFEPWFTLLNWFKLGAIITVIAKMSDA